MKNINSFSIGVLLSVSSSLTAIAQTSADIPLAIFGVGLGSIFEENPISRQVVGLNVTRVTEVRSVDGYGYHIFFEPIDVDSMFPYFEGAKPVSDGFIESVAEHFETSFRLHAYPVIPEEIDHIESLEELEAISPRELEVGLIAWSGLLGPASGIGSASRSFRYDWTETACLVIGGYIETEPEIIDSVAERLYQCTFTGETRELRISSDGGRTIQLKYRDEIIQQKEDEIEGLLSRLSRN